MFNRNHHLILLFFPLLLVFSAKTSWTHPGENLAKPQLETFINQWVQMWNTYDLDQVEKLFLKSDQLSYFSSEKEGVIRGFKNVIDHHVGFGFIKGGKITPNRLWLDRLHFFHFGSVTVITAIWYFQKPDSPRQKGPVTFVCLKTPEGYRLGHLHFGNYPEDQKEGEKKAILSVVQDFFDVIETRDLNLAKKIMIPGGSTFSIRKRGDKKDLRRQTYDQFMASIAKESKKYKEVMHNPRVLIHKDIAMVWTQYTFYINGKKSHTGVDSFSLIKVNQKWRIAGAIYNVEKGP
jgi:hypothetical protein